MRPIVGVGVLIIKDGKVLLGKRNKEPGKNSWSLPGGKLEFVKTLEDCARREVKEETGLEIDEPSNLFIPSKKIIENYLSNRIYG